MKKIVVFVSGNGSNLQAIINAINKKNIIATISCVICNKQNAYSIKRCINSNIPVIYTPYISKNMTRIEYDKILVSIVKPINPDLIILAGWMHILGKDFLDHFSNVINLHPALPNMFPGNNSVEEAYNEFQENLIDYTGIMVHKVIPKIDSGELILKKKIEIFNSDSLNDLKNRIYVNEKELLIKSINKIMTENTQIKKLKSGKVRDIYQIDNNLMLFIHTDKLSSFDRHICDVPGKGNLLNLMSMWWFNQTKHIIDNHALYSKNNLLIAKRCEVIPLEIVVRGYITGNTSTSLWTHYKNGCRQYCGNKIPENLKKNQKLETPIVTPTTKAEIDELITPDEILQRSILTKEEWEYISSKALELFNYGQMVAASKNLILVDTKYEFGRDLNGNIILIDEIHTCDSSRYWISNTYQQLFNNGKEPEKLDKDAIRDYVKSVCDPYKVTEIPSIPDDKLQQVLRCYINLYKNLNNNIEELQTYSSKLDIDSIVEDYISDHHRDIVVILSGSVSDNDFVTNIKNELSKKIFTVHIMLLRHIKVLNWY